MNDTLSLLLNRKSVRAFEKTPVSEDVTNVIVDSALRAPTAGNMMLYTIIHVTRQSAKDSLAKSCDNQPFIARAPLVLLFLADYRRWHDYFVQSQAGEEGEEVRAPQEGDLFLACSDALIAAQTAVIAAESLGLGSCYIGDIMEHYEVHRELFSLPDHVFPVSLVCFGYPTLQQKQRPLSSRFEKRFIVHRDTYRRLSAPELAKMHKSREEEVFHGRQEVAGAHNLGQYIYRRKAGSDFSLEMQRSVREMIRAWRGSTT